MTTKNTVAKNVMEIARPGEEMEIERKIRVWYEVKELVSSLMCNYCEPLDETAYHEIESRIYNFVLKEIFG